MNKHFFYILFLNGVMNQDIFCENIILASHKESQNKKDIKIKNHQKIPHKMNKGKKIKNINPLMKFFNKSNDQYSWSNHVYALMPNHKDLSQYQKIGQFNDMVVIYSNEIVDRSYPVVLNKKNNKIGYYTGKIVIKTQNKLITTHLKKLKLKWTKVSGIYFVDSSNLEDSLIIIHQLKKILNLKYIRADIVFTKLHPM